MRILIVEDDIQLSEVLTEALTRRQHVVDVAHDGAAAWNLVEAIAYDLIVLDVTLPRLNGLQFCHQLRSAEAQNLKQLRSATPILMLTARDTVADKIVGLDAGADDYVTKPFDLEELMARVRALLRRGLSTSEFNLHWGQLQLNPSAHEASYQGQLLTLTPKEYALLELLVASGRRILSRSGIIEQLWAADDTPVAETVNSHIRGLRHKLKALGAPDDFIETVHGLGYRLK
ncbi:MAG TPA: response regulator transcription factor [Leptolyngbyaceae cyanobacterium M33_DOE_097]|uniref:Response regulator transcription factor n=1 Tax=Oscillatoriales cyanobacterium SpSt-418 TaxID=2282169 RepID=A0A7C3PHP2_9CYAN|nr:response regulator transcription factor [Leptolyngbyaceae cyanobacterium M33_DOE_097]